MFDCNKKAIYRIIKFALTVAAVFYIMTGILKLIDAKPIFQTFDFLIKNIFNKEISIKFIFTLVFALAFWEILIGSLIFLNYRIDFILWFFLITNLLFTVVSHYLIYLNRIKSCGCFGSLSQQLSALHLPILYICNIVIITAIIMNIKQANEKEISN